VTELEQGEQRVQQQALAHLRKNFWKVIKVKPRDFQDTPEMWKLYAARVYNRFMTMCVLPENLLIDALRQIDRSVRRVHD
jgi:hypothetical protein